MADQNDKSIDFAARRAAITTLGDVIRFRRPLTDVQIAQGPLAELTPADRARAGRLVDTVLRRLDALDAVIEPHLTHAPPLRVRNILRVCAAELLIDHIPAHGAVNAAVAIVRASPKTVTMAGLVNAVARKLAKTDPAELSTAPQPLPKAIRGALVKAWGAEATHAIEQAHQVRPAVDVTLHHPENAPEWATSLNADILPTGSLRLRAGGQISQMEGFETGAWWVQDAAAALPARALGDVRGKRVLDLCAAPGGKTMQLIAAGAQVTALDVSEHRLTRLRENLKRTSLSAEIVVADALTYTPDAPFDAILLDAPCSATGTIRRHPDLPVVRPSLELAPTLDLQAQLLDRAFDWLTPGGRLVYATCSLIPAEGERQIKRFLSRTATAQVQQINATLLGGDANWATPEGYLRLRPDFWADRGGLDGFFIASLTKS